MKTKVKQIQKNKNLIEGNFFKNIIVFSLPLILSNVLQVLFNMADIAIVGQFDPNGKYLVGAIGSTSMLISLFTGFLIGIGGGINAVIAKDIGRRDAEDIQKGVHSGFLISVIAGFVIVAIGVPCARTVLMLLKTKSALLDDATMYLQIYLLGMPALAVYNHGNGVLAAQGETRRPLIYLTVAGVLNVGLDILFVVVFNMGAAGVALASIIAQYSSAILVFVDLLRSKGAAKFSFKKLTFGGATGESIAILGISAGLQNSIFAIANMFLQSAVNKFDELTVSGNSAAANIDSLCYNMLNAFYMACTTFMGQSFGAGDRKKVKKKLCYIFVVRSNIGYAVRRCDAGLRQIYDNDIFTGRSGNRGRYATSQDNGVFVVVGAVYGLYYSGFSGNRQKLGAYCNSNNGFMRIPYSVDIHGVCSFRHFRVFVFAISGIVGNHCACGNYIFCNRISQNDEGVRASIVM